MNALDQAAEIARRRWEASSRWHKVLLVLGISISLILLLGYLFTKIVRLMVPARINNWSLYFPRVRRH